jgi:hypothetical protein
LIRSAAAGSVTLFGRSVATAPGEIYAMLASVSANAREVNQRTEGS